MEPALSAFYPPPPVCLMGLLSANSRQGFRLAGSTVHQGLKAAKYLNCVGDTTSVVWNAWPESLKAQQQNTGTLNKNKFVNYMEQHAKNKSTGYCALACRKGLAAGGLNTNGHPPDAKGYGPFLLKLGASVVPNKGYTPEKADVIVFAGNKAHPYGHIETYTGKGWVSDFKQRNMIPYRNDVPSYTIYRFPNDQ